jgi:glycerol-1-phosphate dehydrogenase [NAD(P)+]
VGGREGAGLLGRGDVHRGLLGVGTIIAEYLHGGNWQGVRRALDTIDAPTTAEELGIDPQTVVAALTSAHEIRDRYTILGNGMSEAAAYEAAETTGVI